MKVFAKLIAVCNFPPRLTSKYSSYFKSLFAWLSFLFVMCLFLFSLYWLKIYDDSKDNKFWSSYSLKMFS